MGRAELEDHSPAGGRRRTAVTARRGAPARWLWLLVSWVPVWALFAAMILTVHQPAGWVPSLASGLRMSVAAALAAIPVQRLVARLPWPPVFRWRFAALHLLAAPVYAAAWMALNSLIASALHGRIVWLTGPGLAPFLVFGVWIYLMIAGIAYAIQGTERAAHAEATAVGSRLDALRAQLNPHFLFNALHTVIQLIPRQPERAARAAEQLAGLLRTTIEEDRDEVTLREEWAFVERYLDIERIRFGDRLRLAVSLSDEASQALVPSFAVQTLVENALRHGVAPAIEPTEVTVRAALRGDLLEVRVSDTGAGSTPAQVAASRGTALARLRDRLQALHGAAARLDVETSPGAGFAATLTLPQEPP
jgi:anti-sigma regulatory factor (Ser/Thr protein kinase)